MRTCRRAFKAQRLIASRDIPAAQTKLQLWGSRRGA
jgi:hypothetical protein